jgi:hypothetical protein
VRLLRGTDWVFLNHVNQVCMARAVNQFLTADTRVHAQAISRPECAAAGVHRLLKNLGTVSKFEAPEG